MSKLKFDRLLDLKFNDEEKVRIPKGELWKGRIYGSNANIHAFVNDEKVLENEHTITGVENAEIAVFMQNMPSHCKLIIQGIAFKVVENV